MRLFTRNAQKGKIAYEKEKAARKTGAESIGESEFYSIGAPFTEESGRKEAMTDPLPFQCMDNAISTSRGAKSDSARFAYKRKKGGYQRVISKTNITGQTD